LSIIPQEPVLFDGTLRENVDPWAKSADEDLWKVLEESHLKALCSQNMDIRIIDFKFSKYHI
jgi:ABC-type multidrug transport system fused ATPase/permease subunit